MEQAIDSVRDLVDIVVLSVVMLCAIVGIFALVLWARDVRDDRRHSVVVNSPTPIFAGSGCGCDTNEPSHVEGPCVTLRVRRIRYWTDCATVDVESPEGRSGHIVLGMGSVSMHPPLGFVP
jgi:hypothetical protein